MTFSEVTVLSDSFRLASGGRVGRMHLRDFISCTQLVSQAHARTLSLTHTHTHAREKQEKERVRARKRELADVKHLSTYSKNKRVRAKNF